MTILVLAGGLATRLRPLTEKIPKSLVDINGYPFIHHQIELFIKKGATHIHFCLGYLGDQVENYINENFIDVCRFTFSYDGNVLRGTGGAIVNALDILPDLFLVTYGDSFLNIDYKGVYQFAKSNDNICVMTVFKNSGLHDKSNVEFKNGYLIKYSKTDITPSMDFIDYGLLCFNKSVFSGWTKERFDLADLCTDLVQQKKMIGYEVYQRFFEIGSFQGIEDFSQYLKTIK